MRMIMPSRKFAARTTRSELIRSAIFGPKEKFSGLLLTFLFLVSQKALGNSCIHDIFLSGDLPTKVRNKVYINNIHEYTHY
jgi:hypothetical protein